MRKPGLFAVAIAAALVLTGVGTWFASATRARVEPPTHSRVDPMQMMTEQRYVPTEWMVDFSLVFEPTPDGTTSAETPSK